MAKNPYYSEVSATVKTELTKRAGHYGNSSKGLEDLNFAHQKQPYLEVHGLDSSGAPTTGITVFTGGFIDTYASNDRYLPKPILTKCSISNLGRYGTTRKAQVDFTVFTRLDLDKLNDIFFIPGAWIQVKYGWTGYTGVDAKNGKLIGRVYNFSFSLREEDGGYNCNFEIVGEGYFPASTDANSKSTTTIAPGDKDQPAVFENGIIGRLKKDLQSFREERDKHDTNRQDKSLTDVGDVNPHDETTIKVVASEGLTKTIESQGQANSETITREQLSNLITEPNNSTFSLLAAVQYIGSIEKDKYYNRDDSYQEQMFEKRDKSDDLVGIDAVLQESEWTYFVNLHYIVDILINNTIRESVNTTNIEDTKFYFKCNSTCSQTRIPKDFVSADPSKIMFIGQGGKYGSFIDLQSNGVPNTDFNIETPPANETNVKCDLSRMFINAEIVYNILEENKKENPFPAVSFINEIFKEISFYTGGAIQPTLMIPDDKDNKGKQVNYIEIRDSNHTQPYDEAGNPKKIVPYVFNAFSLKSVIRNISMDSTLPNKMATALFVGGAKSMTGVTQEIKNFYTNEEKSSAPAGTNITITEDQALQIQGWRIYYHLPGQSNSPGFETLEEARRAALGKTSNNKVRKTWVKSFDKKWWESDKEKVTIDIDSGTYQKYPTANYKNDIVAGREKYKAVTEGNISAIKHLIDLYGPVPDITTSTIQALKQYSQDGPGSATHPWNQRILLPISLGITLDGIEGFGFGNLITTDWLPSKYFDKKENPRISFIITNVTHTITPNDWVTELETQCRMTP